MVGMTANRPIDTAKGEIKVNESWNPKKRSKKPNGPTW